MASFEEMQKQLLNNYADLLEIQYHNKPKAIDTIKANCEILLANMLMWKIEKECLNVDLSVGVQLDILGKWVGVDRYIQKQDITQRYYSYYDWNTTPNDLQGCLQDWNNPTEENAPFITYSFIVSFKETINDNDFRLLIKLKIIKNNINATCKNIDDEIYNLFKDLVYTTWTKFNRDGYIITGSQPISKQGLYSLPNAAALVATNNAKIDLSPYLVGKNNVKIDVGVYIKPPFTGHFLGGANSDEAGMLNTFSSGILTDVRFRCNNKIQNDLLYLTTITTDGLYQFTYELTPTTAMMQVIRPDKTLLQTRRNRLNFDNFDENNCFLRTGYATQGQVDLLSIKIYTDNNLVFEGQTQDVMNMTYNYQSSQNAIIQIANKKNCLPAPTGVKINLREIE